MANEIPEAIVAPTETEEVEEINEETEETVETPKEPKAEKPKRTPQEEYDYHTGKAKRLAKKLGLDGEPKVEKPSSPKSDLDYGEKAFLRSYDIKGADELALIKNWVNRTGDALDSVVEDDIFQAKLKGLRDARATADATPKGTKRTAAPTHDDEAHWLAKISAGEAKLGDITDRTLREKVLDKQIESQKTGGKFSQNPIVMT